ncbi:UDP-N-acetylglucosamine--undecaprenyl-phosphate N-acetylglucosaminephosphotransferase [Pseudoalteromonas sp. R3]|uniref:UDP-N-acetylglucosamine--undecaprenyl-phosphate N-acetylglucosaminephosphotransferase n=1 Tax=Pseudoalteromonas sp. R3 TaxID=1709477 RepID=UPI0006B41D83|nr:UDP-N-acetylglucosamine--undecaprenyl-phosphate N-acetylglucosaminephosphotransferase [Pseudoalteromonas sp. R3]AZZ99595.1 undecaprenyl-phosphate alpha-N-acetylglucosaminyl 1-phosphate transferase [Pseudoalteromonas sp. R3]
MLYLAPLISSFIFCVMAIYIAKPVAIRTGLVDVPNSRKHHDGHIPLIGGVAIYFGVLMSSMLFFEYSVYFSVYIISASFILFLGVLDDKYDLSVRVRIIVQLAIAIFMIFGTGNHLSSFGSIFGFFEFKLGYFGVVITVLGVIGTINAFNMVDGIDGLAGALSLVSFLALGTLLWISGSEWFLLAILFVASIAAFLMFNLRWPSKSMKKVFMGDAGSMLIGFTIIWLLVIGIEQDVKSFRPVTALYIIAIPLMDMVAIMYRRIKKGTSPFKADRDHLHHIFERAGYSRRRALIIISLAAAFIAFLGGFLELRNTPEWIMFSIFIGMFLVYNYALAHVWRILSWLRRK